MNHSSDIGAQNAELAEYLGKTFRGGKNYFELYLISIILELFQDRIWDIKW